MGRDCSGGGGEKWPCPGCFVRVERRCHPLQWAGRLGGTGLGEGCECGFGRAVLETPVGTPEHRCGGGTCHPRKRRWRRASGCEAHSGRGGKPWTARLPEEAGVDGAEAGERSPGVLRGPEVREISRNQQRALAKSGQRGIGDQANAVSQKPWRSLSQERAGVLCHLSTEMRTVAGGGLEGRGRGWGGLS